MSTEPKICIIIGMDSSCDFEPVVVIQRDSIERVRLEGSDFLKLTSQSVGTHLLTTLDEKDNEEEDIYTSEIYLGCFDVGKYIVTSLYENHRSFLRFIENSNVFSPMATPCLDLSIETYCEIIELLVAINYKLKSLKEYVTYARWSKNRIVEYFVGLTNVESIITHGLDEFKLTLVNLPENKLPVGLYEEANEFLVKRSNPQCKLIDAEIRAILYPNIFSHILSLLNS